MNKPVPSITHCQLLIDYSLFSIRYYSEIIPIHILLPDSRLLLFSKHSVLLAYSHSQIIPQTTPRTLLHTPTFCLLGLLSEPKILCLGTGSCALKRRAGSGRWYTHWQVHEAVHSNAMQAMEGDTPTSRCMKLCTQTPCRLWQVIHQLAGTDGHRDYSHS